jgi:hypothetical protein
MHSEKALVLFLIGVALLAYAAGIVFVTWIKPTSPLRPLLRARWRYGAPASAIGAAVLVSMYGSFGVGLILATFELAAAKWAFTAFGASLIFVLYARIADLGESDEV